MRDIMPSEYPSNKSAFEAALDEAGLIDQFHIRKSVVFGWCEGDMAEAWMQTATPNGWTEAWVAGDPVKCPPGDTPKKKPPPPPPPKVRDQLVDLNNAPDHEKILRWTLAALGKDPDTLRLDQIPGPAYVSMLRYANEEPKVFWGWIAASDKKKEEEAKTKKTFRDDNRRLFEVMDAILSEHAKGTFK